MDIREKWEAELAQRAIGGDTVALGALLAEFSERLREEMKFEIGPRVNEVCSADDIVQDALDHAFRSIGQFRYRGPGSFYAWLKQIARHRAIDAARAQDALKRGGDAQRIRMNDEQASRLINSVDALKHDSTTPSREIARRERTDAIRIGLMQLSPQEREVIHLRFVERLDWPDVAARLGRTLASARSLAHRAIEKLEELLGEMSRFLTSK